MSKGGFRGRFVRFTAATLVGGTVFQLSGCDAEVRDALLTGLEATSGSLLDTLNSAFFISLQDDAQVTDQGLTTTSSP